MIERPALNQLAAQMIDGQIARGAEKIRAHVSVHVPARTLRPDAQKHVAHELFGDGPRVNEAVRVAAERFIVRREQRAKRERAPLANGCDDLAIIFAGEPVATDRLEGWRHDGSPRVAALTTDLSGATASGSGEPGEPRAPAAFAQK